MRSESISLSYPWCKSFRNHYFHCYYFQSVAWYFLQNLLLCTVQASEFWKTTIEVMISYKTEMTTLISLIINVEPTLTDFEKFHPPQKKSPLHVYWFHKYIPTSMFIPASTFSDLAIFASPPRLFQPPRLLERWE